MPGLKDALLYANKSLDITQNLRAVQFLYQENPLELKLIFYYDGEYTNQDYGDSICMETEVFCEFESYLKLEIQSLKEPLPLPSEGLYIYMRGEQLWDEKGAPLYPPKSPYARLPDSFFQNIPSADRIVLATQQALLGKIPWHLRYVCSSVHETRKELYFLFIFDKECGEKERKLALSVVHEVKKQFSEDYVVKEAIVRCDFPRAVFDFFNLSFAMYSRYEYRLYSEEQGKDRNDSMNYCGKEKFFRHFMSPALNFTIPYGIRAIKIGKGINSGKDYLMVYRTKESLCHVKFLTRALSSWVNFYNHELRVVKVDETTPIPEFGYDVFAQSASDLSPPNMLLEKLKEKAPLIKSDEILAITADVDEQEETLHVWIYHGEEKKIDEEEQKRIRSQIQSLACEYRAKVTFYKLFASDMFFYYFGKPMYISEKITIKEDPRRTNFPVPFFKLRLFQALLGRINPDLYAVKFGYNDAIKTIYLWFYYSAIPDDGAKALEQEIASHTCPWDGYKTVICSDFHDPKQELPSVGSLIFERMVKEE